MRGSFLVGLMAASVVAAVPAAAESASLRGSPSSMVRQHEVATGLEYTFLRTPGQVREFVSEGRLVEIRGNGVYEVSSGVSYPYARPELRLFIERLGAQYREGCGEALVVTSLTRPLSSQPRNAHRLSVHPAGMAVDLRVSERAECREWLESTLLSLERKELLDVTRERNPPHYHVAVFPEAYLAYATEQAEAEAEAALAAEAAARAAERERVAAAALTLPVERPAAPAEGGGGRARFSFAVLLSVALVLTLGRAQAHRRDAGR